LDAEEAIMQLKSAEPGSAGYPWSRREEAKAQAITKGWRSVFAGARTRRKRVMRDGSNDNVQVA
jgi:hypothetical protein